MRLPFLILACLMIIGCGKTGALYLPDETETDQKSTNSSEQAE